jgi:hypothetical protein
VSKNDVVTFDVKTRRRLRVACRALGTSYAEFVVFAVKQALDEIEGIARDNRY